MCRDASVILATLVLAVCTPAWCGDNPSSLMELTAGDVVDVFSSIDRCDARLSQVAAALASSPTSYIPQIVEALEVTNTARCLPGLLQFVRLGIRGDRSIFVPRVRELVASRKYTQLEAIATLGVIGTAADNAKFLGLLTDNDADVRHAAEEALANKGDENAAEQMELILRERAAGKTTDEFQADTTLGFGFEMLRKLKVRLLNEKIEAEQDGAGKAALVQELKALQESSVVPEDLGLAR